MEILRHRIQRHGDTETQTDRDMEILRHRQTETWRY